MAPEQIRGDGVDARTDIYALGVVLYHLLTGQYPFRAETMTDIERQHLEAPPPRPSQAAPRAAGAGRGRAALHGEDRRAPLPDASRRSSRRCATRSAPRRPSPRSSARGAAIYVEIRIADGADAESDEVLDDTSAILDAAEQSLRGAGMTLPLQTGNAIIGARVLSADAGKAAGERDADAWRSRTTLAQELAARPSAHADVHVNIVVHVGRAVVKDSADAPGGKEIVGGELLVDRRLGAAGERRRRPRDRRRGQRRRSDAVRSIGTGRASRPASAARPSRSVPVRSASGRRRPSGWRRRTPMIDSPAMPPAATAMIDVLVDARGRRRRTATASSAPATAAREQGERQHEAHADRRRRRQVTARSGRASEQRQDGAGAEADRARRWRRSGGSALSPPRIASAVAFHDSAAVAGIVSVPRP